MGKDDKNIRSIKLVLLIIYVISTTGECVLFPQFKNVMGCAMAGFSLYIFGILFTRRNLICFPFSFSMYLSMFLYRFLPLPATLVENKPISYGMELPTETFIFELLLFLVGSAAFYFSTRNLKNNRLQNFLFKNNFYTVNTSLCWAMGIVGLIIRIYTFSATVEFGDVGGKFFSALNYFLYAPLLLLFPRLLNINSSKKNKTRVIVYAILITIINLASNSREAAIAPFLLLALLFFLDVIKSRVPIKHLISSWKSIVIVISIFGGLTLFGDISAAMLQTRAIRNDVSKTELFKETMVILLDRQQMKIIRKNQVKSENTSLGNNRYSYIGWTEDYIDNFMLNRYANMRISDQTLYLANKIGYSNKEMRNNLYDYFIFTFPTPILNLLDITFDKSAQMFSRGDFLFAKASGTAVFAGFRVTSHLADGLATFGFFYFILQYISWVAIFYLLNNFSIFHNKKLLYSPLALMNLFIFTGMFRNANGIASDIGFIVRGFWQLTILYCVVLFLLRYILNIFKQAK